MATTKLLSNGRVVIPKSSRDAHGWEAGVELMVIDTGDGVLLKPKSRFAPARLSDIAGVLKDKVVAKTDQEIESALREEVQRQSPQLLAETAASISEFKADPMKVVASGKGMPVVVLNRSEPAFYCVPARTYEAIMEFVDDLELLELVKERGREDSVRVSVEDL
jgi:antitoxin StbD